VGPLIKFVEVWFQVVNYLRFQVREMFKLTLRLTDYQFNCTIKFLFDINSFLCT
jgi:hypothetical protein